MTIPTSCLVQQSREERLRRERERLENEAALRIQSFIRGCLGRSTAVSTKCYRAITNWCNLSLRCRIRAIFDQTHTELSQTPTKGCIIHLKCLLRSFNLFFRSDIDKARL
ncbi:unnamed protein product, partial [Protopolystoma xenopodis]